MREVSCGSPTGTGSLRSGQWLPPVPVVWSPSPVTFPLLVSSKSWACTTLIQSDSHFLLVAMPRTTSIHKKPYPTIPTPCPLRSLIKSQLLHPPTSRLGVLTVNADKMAAQMSKYMVMFEEHASITRKDPDFSNAYQCCLDEGRALPPDTKWLLLDEQGIRIVQSRMEAILERQATVTEE